MTTHSIRDILNTIENIQSRMSLKRVAVASRSGADFRALLGELNEVIAGAVEQIGGQLSKRGLTAADLSIRSRRAYQWLCFLTQSGSLAAHLDALQRMSLFLPGVWSAAGKKLPAVELIFYHQAALYQVRLRGGQIEIKIQESFITAPDQVLISLAKQALKPDQKDRRLIKEYTFNQDYQELRQELEYLGVPGGIFAAGRAQNLEQVFDRVNSSYFSGQVKKPNLVWSKRLTHRKFGHYQWDTDTVMISSTLDRAGIPELVLDYVMYHELLHKKLGAKRTKHTRTAHTREFRQREAEFRGLAEARMQLDRIARRQARSRA